MHKETVRRIAIEVAQNFTSLETTASVNAADDLDKGDVFLTLTGTSAEAGDDGETGRGNRACGLITPCRPMTIEAPAGKNPASHVGKLYQVVATRAAKRLTTAGDLTDATCMMVGRIGDRVADPQIVSIAASMPDAVDIETVKKRAGEILRDEFDHLDELRRSLLQETISLF